MFITRLRARSSLQTLASFVRRGVKTQAFTKFTKSATTYQEQGYAILSQAIKQEDAESLRSAGNVLIRSVAEQPQPAPFAPGLFSPLPQKVRDEYLFYTGGRKVSPLGSSGDR